MGWHGLAPWLRSLLRYVQPLLIRVHAVSLRALALIATPTTDLLLGGKGPHNAPCHPPTVRPQIYTETGRRSHSGRLIFHRQPSPRRGRGYWQGLPPLLHL